MLGRLSLNPLKHIDPMGTVIVPLVLLFVGGFLFGWAKPVPVAFRNLRHPKRDMILVAAAGPIANFVMATGWALLGLLLYGELGLSGSVADWLIGNCLMGIQINVILAIFNLVPIPPLDGGRVLAGLLPRAGSNVLERIEPFGLIIVLLLMVVPNSPLPGLLEPFFRFFNDFYQVNVMGLA
jgi:Zn-dependent protease